MNTYLKIQCLILGLFVLSNNFLFSMQKEEKEQAQTFKSFINNTDREITFQMTDKGDPAKGISHKRLIDITIKPHGVKSFNLDIKRGPYKYYYRIYDEANKRATAYDIYILNDKFGILYTDIVTDEGEKYSNHFQYASIL